MRIWVAAAAVVTVVGAAGCGSNDDYKNEPRPPAPIVLTASISDQKVSVSPSSFGAGPVSLIITNQTGSAQKITFKSTNGAFNQSTGPINPSETATLKVDVPQGAATVTVGGGGVNAAKLKVGPPRKSAQNELLLP